LFSSGDKLLFVEGNPGVGKSTSLRKLARVWASEQCEEGCSPECVHIFTHVFLTRATDFCGKDSVEDVLLPELDPRDCETQRGVLKGILNGGRCLILVDAYDEAFNDNPLLRDIIEANESIHFTTLVTSRPGYLWTS
jgi:MoxR-like ATPase